METPTIIKPNESDYKQNAWQEYSIQELGNWVHLLVKRSKHRSSVAKANKDIHDAEAYLAMIQAHIDAARP